MSAPAGWHLQPDGRERYWDGAQWTEQFRVPAPTEPMDPTAPPPPSSWTPTVDETQVLDVSGTQALPQAQPTPPSSPGSPAVPGAYGSADPTAYASPEPTAYPAPQQYSYPSGAGGLPPAAPPGSGYGAPGGQWQAPPRSGASGLAKGCLVAALGVVLLIGIAVVAGIFFISRAAEEVVDNLPSTFPTELPSGLPTELPTDLPSGVPTEGLGDRFEIAVGNGFELPRAVIQDGWRLEAQGGGVPIVQVRGMRATLADGDGFPVLFTMSVPGDGGDVETVCTAAAGASGATVDVSCVPFFGDVSDATRATVTATL